LDKWSKRQKYIIDQKAKVKAKKKTKTTAPKAEKKEATGE
tara:strand:+ start:448 stop:567 length:120 start_codon:yes stop_codon:yes gene_type:complete